MTYISLNKKLMEIVKKIKTRYKKNEALSIFSILFGFMFVICFFTFFVGLIEESEIDLTNKTELINQLKENDSENLERIKELERELNLQADTSEGREDSARAELEEYKKELDSLIESVNKKLDVKKLQEYERYKLYITTNEIDNKSTISITDSQNNITLGEKIVVGTIEGDYGNIHVTSYFYQKVFFSIDPIVKDCENTSSNTEIEKCLEEIKNINKTYGEVGGLWYFDLKTHEFVQISKLSEIYNGEVSNI